MSVGSHVYEDPEEQPQQHRRQWVKDCPFCAQFKPTEMFPPHDAGRNCESGKREHCSCDACF